ncbi:hypothetical protein [Scytonema sp. PCC 10023]|uniref:hypothetical protein n=1 Tax=Scytonema sp. PCC 10023 TaxID=1680591 RepID=UPI0039C6812E
MKKFQLSLSALTQALVASLTQNKNTASTTTSETDGDRGGGVVCVPKNGGSRYNAPCKPGDTPIRVK